MSDYAVDVTSATFQQQVIEASKSTPVVVDFWAPWCGPCRSLTPVLEKLAAEYAGKFKLAKVNSDENQDLAAAFGIRSIPDVVAFRDGEAVSHFLGALPESQVRAFVDKLIPTPSQLEQARARELRETGDTVAAAIALRKAIDLDAANDAARLDLADVLIERKQLDEAAALLDAVRPDADPEARGASLRAALGFARAAVAGAGDADLKARLVVNPADHEARLALAGLHAGAKRYRDALDDLLEIVRADKNWKQGEARKQILAIFSLAGEQPDLVSAYRRKLASALN